MCLSHGMNFEAWLKSTFFHGTLASSETEKQLINLVTFDAVISRISLVQLFKDAILLILEPEVHSHSFLLLSCDERANEVLELLTI